MSHGITNCRNALMKVLTIMFSLDRPVAKLQLPRTRLRLGNTRACQIAGQATGQSTWSK